MNKKLAWLEMIDTLDLILQKHEEGRLKSNEQADPFSVIPLRNHKCARETVEIYLGKRGIDTLINFQYFKNLEVLWLNHNNLVKVDGLDANFRIKELYLHNNNLRTLDGSLKHMKHLNILTLYNNELSNLDQNIDFLSDFVYLEHLELWGNPLSEEPNYRINVIHSLRTLKLFDRHNVSDLERIAADKFIKDNKIIGQKKPRKKAFKVFEQISDIERETMHMAKRYMKEDGQAETKRKALEIDEYEKIKLMEKPPLNDALLKLQKFEDNDRSSRITEWEKSKFLKSFKAFDPKKEGAISIEDALKVFEEMGQDKHMIGKSPSVSGENFKDILEKLKNTNGKVGWNRFRNALDDFDWEQFSVAGAEQRINALYKEAQSLFFTNKREESLQKVLNALSIDKNLRK